MKLLFVLVLAALAAAGAVRVTPEMLQQFKQEATNTRTIDISHRFVEKMPIFFGGPQGLPAFFVPRSSIKKGDMANTINFTLNDHYGTHLDAPGYYNQTLQDQGHDVDSLDINTLTGSCLVVDTPRDKNITAEVMAGLGIPQGVERVLFKTLNTDRKLMYQSRFDPSYTAFTPEGAQYLVDNTHIKLVGIDYLSVGVGVEEDYTAVYRTLLNKEIITVEGLKLDEVEPGKYEVECLPLRLPTLDGSPARCLLITTTSAGSSASLSSSGLSAVFVFHFVIYVLFF